MDGGLFFATAEALEERVRELAQDGDQRALVLDLEGVNFVDSQGAAKLGEIHQLTEADGVTLRLARVRPQVLAVLQADGIVDRIGAEHVHGNVYRAVEAQLGARSHGGGRDASGSARSW
jgi:sulfate permease, SulP family